MTVCPECSGPLDGCPECSEAARQRAWDNGYQCGLQAAHGRIGSMIKSEKKEAATGE